MGYFTKYICFYKLDNNYTLLLNTLTSAVDIVDNETLTEIKAMIKKHNNKVIIDKNYPLYGVLKKRGYIFDNESAEKNTPAADSLLLFPR